MSSIYDWNFSPSECLIAQNNEVIKLLELPLLQKDIWRTIEDLGLQVNEHYRVLTINFEPIKQDWLKLLTKLYVLVRSKRNVSPLTLSSHVGSVNKFSQFILRQNILSPHQINNGLFEDFDYYLQSLKLSKQSISLIYTALNNLFTLCRQERWLDISTYWFKGRHKNIIRNHDEIEYIPEHVWQQLDQHLHHLPEPIQRMVLVIRGTGLRIGELLNLPLDCLRQRGEQWRLRFLTEKYLTEDELPICPELVAVIREQQSFIKDNFGDSYSNLFGSNDGNNCYYKPAPRVMKLSTFNRWLNKLAKKYNICTKSGEIWHFASHQFRRTFATVMANAGVRDLIIQKYLRHRSPDMQNHYKHLLKQVLGSEYQELIKSTKYVDSTGKLVTEHKPKNPMTEFLRRRMYQITTQYGECHRPILKSPCQTVNACWRCEHWRTSESDLDYLKKDRQRVETELEIAVKLGMVRQQKGLTADEQSLKIRIQGLEDIQHEN